MMTNLLVAGATTIVLAVSPVAALPILPAVLGRSETCTKVLNSSARISRANLRWLLGYNVGEPSVSIVLKLGGAYCFLRQEGDLELYAYPMAADPSTWIIVKLHHRRETYQGYDLSYGNRQPSGGL